LVKNEELLGSSQSMLQEEMLTTFLFTNRFLAYSCTLLGLGFLPRLPRRPCGRSVRKIASIVFVGILRVLLACRARDFCGLGIGFVFLAFSQRLIPSGFGEKRYPRFLLWSWRLFLVVCRRVRLMEGVVCDFLVARGGPDFRLFGFLV
jgi:hypothetical protein